MRATVCELPDERDLFERQWRRFVNYAHAARTEWMLLPDMPFCEWFADADRADDAVWRAAVRAHDAWEHRLSELEPAIVLGTRPIDFGNEKYDEAFVWDAEQGLRSVHAKARVLPQEDHEWTWYHHAAPDFVPMEVHGILVGFLIGSEVWAEDEAVQYGNEHVHLLAMPRSVRELPYDDWLDRARTAAQCSHAYVLSSNRSGSFGGQACIIAPDGDVLGATSEARPFLTLDIPVTGEAHVEPTRPPASLDPLDTGVPPY